MHKFILLTLLPFICGNLKAQTTNNEQLSRLIDSLVQSEIKLTEPGCAILISQNGEIVYQKAFGSANLELNVPLETDMVFRIGSLTKQFTAVAILQLMEKGLLSLQDNIQKHIPDFPIKEHNIMIEHLMSQTSGLKEYTAISHHDPYIERHDFTPEFLIDHFKNQPLEFEPGAKYGYSNSNYVLLGYIIEKVSGEKYHKYMENHILKPLGLSRTYYAVEQTIVPKRVVGYTRDRGFFENCAYQTTSLGYACGDLMSTVGDLNKWNDALLHFKPIKKETLEEAYTPYKLKNGTYAPYGYGWFIDSFGRSKCIHHEGQVSGFIAQEKYFPEEKVYSVILTNVKSGEDTTDFSERRFRVFDRIFSIATGKSVEKDLSVDESILQAYVGTYRTDNFISTDGQNKTAFKEKKKEYITITFKDGRLYASLSNGSGKGMVLMAQSVSSFVLPDVKRIPTSIEFIKQNGKPIGLYWQQERKIECSKIK
jgi:CubicO group peptidase (beta-lactamase class C family)